MNQTFGALEQLYIRSIPTVVFVIVLFLILDYLFFGPIARVMNRRAEATEGAIEAARKQASLAEEKSHQYDSAIQAARFEIYSARQEERRRALEEREQLQKTTRARAELMVKEAQTSIATEAATAKEQLTASSESLAMEITERILGDHLAPQVNERAHP
jgi:F-type H+-transporting ATPase subunit b